MGWVEITSNARIINDCFELRHDDIRVTFCDDI